MQFIKDGPDIPDSLLQAHEEGNVVFFCGAGISYPANLPGFEGLVDEIYTYIGEKRNNLESIAYDKKQFDSTLDLLEKRIVGERKTVRQALFSTLTPNYRKKNALRTHESLLKLSCDSEGMTRLVTTNFDRVFEKVIKLRKLKVESFIAPFLPIPKKSRWDGLVYLHGLIPEKEDHASLNRLVFTSGDFGLAYLTERWASRFVSELFRSYVICFVGYSINDPVLRYMMDALAADRMLGETVPEAYAFGDFKLGDECAVKDEWLAKGVNPILYSIEESTHDHSKLHDTLAIWANTYADGSLGKESIIAKHAIFPPMESTKEDDYVGRVLWALSETSGLPAKCFAELNPCPSINWLKKLSEKRLSLKDLPRFGIEGKDAFKEDCSFSLIERPTPSSKSEWSSIRTISSNHRYRDHIMFQVSRWLLRQLNDPEVVFWLTEFNGQLSHDFKWSLQRKLEKLKGHDEEKKSKLLEDSPNAIPDDEMMLLWRMLLANRVIASTYHMDIYDWLKRVKLTGFNSSLKIELRELLAPKIKIRKPFNSSSRRYDWELTLSAGNINNDYNEIKKVIGDEKLGEAFEDFQLLLVDALNLAREMGGADNYLDKSHWDLPSISDHQQNKDFHDWVNLIKLLRDSWLQILANDLSLASALAMSWFNKPYPVFKRLALFAARYDGVVSTEIWSNWLCVEDGWWLWSSETRRETMRLLVLQGKNLSASSKMVLETTILNGLPRRMFRQDLGDKDFKEMNEHAIWIHLAKLQQGEVCLSEETSTRYIELVEKNPNWKVDNKYEKDEFSYWMSGTGDPDYDDSCSYELAPTELTGLMEWLMKSSSKNVYRDEDNWKDVCKDNFELASNALSRLSANNSFPAKRWNTAIWSWCDIKVANTSWEKMVPIMCRFSDTQIYECIHSLARWLEVISKSLNIYQDKFVCLIGKILSVYEKHEKHEKSQQVNLTDAINNPVGIATEAFINYWFTTAPKDNEQLKESFSKIYSKICRENSNIFDHGKLILASRTVALYRVDPEWTKLNLIPFFDWKTDKVKAGIVWNGFLWAPRIYLPLIEVIKDPFIETSLHLLQLENDGRQYIQLFIYIALEQNSVLSDDEIRKVLEDFSNTSLDIAASTLTQAFRASKQKREYWTKRVFPLWKNSWPKSKGRLSEKVTKEFMSICIDSEELFPEIFSEFKVTFQKIQQPDFLIHKLFESDLSKKHPNEVIELIDAIVDQNRTVPYKLGQLLKSIQTDLPCQTKSSKLEKLMAFAKI